MSRAKPSAPTLRPFANFSRPKWWHEAKARAFKRILEADCPGVPEGFGRFSTLLKIVLDGYRLTDDECMVFDIERHGHQKAMTRMLSYESPLFKAIPKRDDFVGDRLEIPIVYGVRK